MKFLVKLTERAARDLEIIYEFIEAQTSESAFAWFQRLAESIYSLETHPERGTLVPHSKKVRQLLFGEKPNTYKINYIVDMKKKVVNVLHIRHGARREWLIDETNR